MRIELTFSQFMVALVFLMFIGMGCSHTAPYSAMSQVVEEWDTGKRVKHRVLLFGDGGAPSIDKTLPAKEMYRADATLTSLYRWAERMSKKTTIIFLGDNIYDVGLPREASKWYKTAERKLKAQLSVVKASDAHGLFVPGNHDWANGGKGGWAAVLRQEKFVNRTLGTSRPSFLPKGAHPGPEKVDRAGVRIIALDTQWWLHFDDDKPVTLNADDTEESAKQENLVEVVQRRVIEKLRGYLNTSGQREVIVVAHHPLATHGPHGGFFEWRDYLFPLTNLSLPLIKKNLWIPIPIVGSIYPLARWHLFRDNQDLNGSRNQELVRALKNALSGENKPLIYAAGHEHSLQVLNGEEAADYILVSGSGSKTSGVRHGADTFFAHEHLGFMAVDFIDDGRVLLRIIEPTEQQDSGEVVFSKWLK